MKLKISELGKVITGNTPSKKIKEFWDKDDVGFVKPDIISDEHIVKIKSEDCNEFISNAAISKARIVPKNSIFVTCIGNIGKIGVATENLAFNQQINAIIPNENVNLDYLCYAIFANKTRLQDIANAPIVPLLNKSQFSEFELEFDMDINTQTRIVHELNTVSNIILKYKQELLLLDELVRARFVEMFGDPIQNSKGYPIRQFSDYIISLTSGSRGWAKYCVNDGKEWFITIKNVKDCNIITDNIQPINAPSNAEAKRTKVEEGDLLISITADLGRTGVVTKEVAEHGAYINQHLSCIRIDREILNPLYVAYYMESSAGKRQFIQKNQSAVKAGLNFNSINSLKLLVPPMEEQNKFIRFVKQIDKSRLLSNHLLFLIKSIIF